MPGTAFPLKVPATEATLSDLESLDDTKRKPAGASRAGGGRLEIIYRPDPTVWDGNFSNNGWLQELPKPNTKLTWDNAAMLSPATAQRLRVVNEDVVELHYDGRKLKAPVWIMPGHA